MTTVSVVVPIFNAGRFLREAVEGVLQQTYRDWELFLVDDESSDGSIQLAAEYAERFGPKVRHLFHPDRGNRGPAATRNRGVEEARGKYVAFLDADDVWLPDKLALQVRLLEQHPDVGLLYTKVLSVDENTKELTRPLQPTGPLSWFVGEVGSGTAGQPYDAYEAILSFNGRVYVPTSTAIVSRRLLDDIGGFPVGCKHFVEDRITWTRIAKRAPLFFDPKVTAFYRVHDANWTSKQNDFSMLETEWEYYCRVAATEPRMDMLLADHMVRLIKVYWYYDGIPLSLRLARIREIIRCLRNHRALGSCLRRYMVRWLQRATPQSIARLLPGKRLTPG
jgi:glycosyltransferase involved in cell wall biosynthesis